MNQQLFDAAFSADPSSHRDDCEMIVGQWMSRGISYKTITAAKAGLGHYRNIMPSRDWRIIERTIVERVVR